MRPLFGGHCRSCLIFIVVAGLVEPLPEQKSELVSLVREAFSILGYHLTYLQCLTCKALM